VARPESSKGVAGQQGSLRTLFEDSGRATQLLQLHKTAPQRSVPPAQAGRASQPLQLNNGVASDVRAYPLAARPARLGGTP
jgi:hypothetical protein